MFTSSRRRIISASCRATWCGPPAGGQRPAQEMKRDRGTVRTGGHTHELRLPAHRFRRGGWNAILGADDARHVYGIYEGDDTRRPASSTINRRSSRLISPRRAGPGEGANEGEVAAAHAAARRRRRGVPPNTKCPIESGTPARHAEQIGNDGRRKWRSARLDPDSGIRSAHAWLDLDGNICSTCKSNR